MKRARAAELRAASGNKEGLEMLRRVDRRTKQEIEKGNMGSPWSLQGLFDKFTESDESLRCRVLLRSVLLQSVTKEEEDVRPDGSKWKRMMQKMRLIDDARRSLHNTMQRPSETTQFYNLLGMHRLGSERSGAPVQIPRVAVADRHGVRSVKKNQKPSVESHRPGIHWEAEQ